MRLSQLLKVVPKHNMIIVHTNKNVPLNERRLYRGRVGGITKDSPINKGHVTYLMAYESSLLVEISLDEGEKNEFKQRRN